MASTVLTRTATALPGTRVLALSNQAARELRGSAVATRILAYAATYRCGASRPDRLPTGP